MGDNGPTRVASDVIGTTRNRGATGGGADAMGMSAACARFAASAGCGRFAASAARAVIVVLAVCVPVAAFAAPEADSGSVKAVPDPLRGERLYARCLACHALSYDRVGPRHCGVFGRLAGSVPGFDYSAAMKDSKLRWDAATLDRFLAAPLGVVPGSTMTYAGVPDARDRADLIAYLRQADRSPECAAASTR
jgi:cytochrome c